MKKYFWVLIWLIGLILEGGISVRAQEAVPTSILEVNKLSQDSAQRRLPISLKSNIKAAYNSNEKIKVELFNNDVNTVQVKIRDEKNKDINANVAETDSQGTTTLTVNPPSQFRPGKYKMMVTDQTGQIIEQDFLWGVLAINPNKAVYRPGETANLSMAVLDELGKMVCDARLSLKITDNSGHTDELSTENGKITVNPECTSREFTTKPDYEADYKLGSAGDYGLELTAITKNGTYTINDQVGVKSNSDFEVERNSATRIFPRTTYPMEITIKANRDFEGTVEEEVPVGFLISASKDDRFKSYEQVTDEDGFRFIRWQVDLKKGETVKLGYDYDAPDVSPQFYLLGPLVLSTVSDGPIYQEGRQWQVAADDLSDSGYHFQTGYYIGNGNFNHVSGLGFRPQMVVIKSDAATFATIFKTDVMPNNTVEYLGAATAESAAGFIQLEDDGFSVSTTAATANGRFTWEAFAGSNCSVSGVFCTGSYTGNGSYPRSISTGFDPDLVWVKRNTAVAAGWKSTAMPALGSQYFHAAVGIGTTDYFTTLGSGAFGIGVSTNVNAGIYYYAAFKQVAGVINVGVTIGTGGAMTINSPNFQPDWVFLKNEDVATTGAVSLSPDSNGDNSSYFANYANVPNMITGLGVSGFTVGTNPAVSGVGNTLYWAAFKSDTTPLTSSGSFKMTTGSYLGTGNAFAIENLAYAPNLVIVKGNTAQFGVFRTDQMAGDWSAYMDTNVANLAGAVTDLTDHGFNIGNNAVVNSVGVSYYWTSYGNAWRPGTKSGASDFLIGAYTGNGVDATDIGRLPYQLDLLAVKRSGASPGTFRTSEMVGDTSAFFGATAETTDNIQAFHPNGFEVGLSANVNSLGQTYWFYGFKVGTGFTLGTYSGSGVTGKNINLGFQPDYLWVKGVGGTRGVARFTDMTGNAALPFLAIGTTTNVITGIGTTGFTLGTAGESNKSGLNYRYAAWKESVGTTTVNPFVNQLLRHGMWFSNGVRQKFTF